MVNASQNQEEAPLIRGESEQVKRYNNPDFHKDLESLEDCEPQDYGEVQLEIETAELSSVLEIVQANLSLLDNPRHNYLLAHVILKIINARPIQESELEIVDTYLNLVQANLELPEEEQVEPNIWIRELLQQIILSIPSDTTRIRRLLQMLIFIEENKELFTSDTLMDGNYGDSLVPLIIRKYGYLEPNLAETIVPYENEEGISEYEPVDYDSLCRGITTNPDVQDILPEDIHGDIETFLDSLDISNDR